MIQAKKRRKAINTVLTYVMLVLIAIVCAGPFIWLLAASFRSGQNIYDISLIPQNPTLENYIGVWEFLSVPRYLLNTIIITVASIAMDVILSALCAYPLACMRFKGKNFILGVLLASMIIPAAAGMIINYLTISAMHLLNTLAGVVLVGSVKVFSIILLRQGYMGVPKDLIEAARIDGAGELRIWWQIMLPGIMPTVSTVIIFDFISRWNEFLWPIIVLQDPAKYPLAAALQYLNGSFNYKFGYIAAGAIISVIPVIVVFILCQKNYIEAVSGAVKG
ncbi:carbohydrate ABC transporter permease [Allofournierella massiliensis]|uniref:Carbohydrate ABC transporter membrane protein 2 (CUT1 family) n=1 Tax=Allofournierella massiliensis TaxID=1650663 RepID=A0A4R1R720_9FIRM|nr:carbohydrate ABC transporter permease [Fournierella massiliensis]TCL61401.1 carbohydrate ABC transporter membrane protein 2 (CUT1 family) [Fournierella massiliensis]